MVASAGARGTTAFNLATTPSTSAVAMTLATMGTTTHQGSLPGPRRRLPASNCPASTCAQIAPGANTAKPTTATYPKAPHAWFGVAPRLRATTPVATARRRAAAMRRVRALGVAARRFVDTS